MKKIIKEVESIVVIVIVMMIATVSVFAASSGDPDNNVATENDLNNADIIDISRKGSLTIYKYDMTSAMQDGVYEEGESKATGEVDSELQEAMSDYAVEGVEFTYLHCGNVETYSVNDGTHNFVELVYEIPNDLRMLLSLETDSAVPVSCSNDGICHYTSQQLNDAMRLLIEADNIEAKNKLENYVVNSTESVSMPLTDKSGLTQAENMDLGLYLIVETRVPEEVVETVNPWFIQLPFTNTDPDYDSLEAVGEYWLYDITCYPKNQTGSPTLDKMVRNGHGKVSEKVGSYEDYSLLVSNNLEKEGEEGFVSNREEYIYDDTTTASEGDILDYIIVSKLPHISSESTYLTEYTFVDTLSKGLTYNEDVRLAFYHTKEDAMVNNTVNADEIWGFDEEDNYSQEYVKVQTDFDSNPGESRLTVSFTESGLTLLNTRYSDFYVVVYYTVTFNSDASAVLGDEGNPNDVTLTWRRTSEDYYDTLEDRCYVYTFGLNLKKNFSDSMGDATKVKFVLYNSSDAYYVIAENIETVEGRKVYYVTGKTTEEEKATVFSPDQDGVLLVSGLEGDSYQLTEIETDDGYSLLKEPIVIVINTAKREIISSVAGRIGLKDPENGHEHKEECYDKSGALICGKPSLDDPDGRTIGKTAMYEGQIEPASATVDNLESVMSEYIDNSDVSENAYVDIGITNGKGFLLPITGGYGTYAVTIMGVLAVALGSYFVVRKKKS